MEVLQDHSQSSSNSDVVGAVLAGGKSSRMGSDKRYLAIQGTSLLERAENLLNNLSLKTTVISGDDLSHGVKDLVPDQGPVAAMMSVVSAMENGNVGGFLFIPVDMPNLTQDSLNLLISRGRELRKPVYYNDSYLPLFLPGSEQLVSQLRDSLNNGKGSIREYLTRAGGITLEAQEQQLLVNVNRPQDWSDYTSKNTME